MSKTKWVSLDDFWSRHSALIIVIIVVILVVGAGICGIVFLKKSESVPVQPTTASAPTSKVVTPTSVPNPITIAPTPAPKPTSTTPVVVQKPVYATVSGQISGKDLWEKISAVTSSPSNTDLRKAGVLTSTNYSFPAYSSVLNMLGFLKNNLPYGQELVEGNKAKILLGILQQWSSNGAFGLISKAGERTYVLFATKENEQVIFHLIDAKTFEILLFPSPKMQASFVFF